MSNLKIRNVLSLFDGISCGQLALNRAGINYENYYASEIEKHAIQITISKFPNTIQLGDVSKININNLPSIDLLIGGSPCTNLSFKGKKEGMVTTDNIEVTSLEQYLDFKDRGYQFVGQSYLFWEYVRILKSLKPRYFLLENVVMSKKNQKLFTNILGVEPIKINSALVSGQRRNRLYWTNINNGNISQPEDRKIMFYDIIDKEAPYREIYPYMYKNYGNKQRLSMSIICTDQKSACLTTSPHDPFLFVLNEERSLLRQLTISEYEILQTLPLNYTEGIPKTKRYRAIGNGWTIDVIAHIFSYLKN